MNVYITWCYHDVAVAAREADAECLAPELDMFQRALQPEDDTRKLAFDRELLAVQVTVPALRRTNSIQLATRLNRGFSVALLARRALDQVLGEELDMAKQPQIRLVGFAGLNDFMHRLATHCSLTERPVPYRFWSRPSQLIELPVTGPASAIDVFRGMVAHDVAGQWAQQLLDDWSGVGVSAEIDMKLLLAAASRLRVAEANEDLDEPTGGN